MPAKHADRKLIIGGDRASQGTVVSKTAYEGTVIGRAMGRAGRNPHLKGHIHEILVQDTRNARNLLAMNGANTQLTRSTTAGTVDLVTTRGGKVIERIQVKDVTSQSGVSKLVRQCAEGKYRSAKLVGSEETARAFNSAARKAGISKRMASTGLSSSSTESLAQRAGATGSGSIGGAIGNAAKYGGAAGAIASGGFAAIKGCVDLANGRATGAEVAGQVARATARGGVTGAAASSAATASGAMTSGALAMLGVGGGTAAAVTLVAPVAVAAVIGYGASKLFDWLTT